MRTFSNVMTVLGLVFIVGCVVIPDTFDANINVTIRHIQEQAEGVLNYVEGKSNSLPGLDAPARENSSLLDKTRRMFSPMATAHAQEMKDASPRVQQIADKMKDRYADLQAIKRTGAVGENNRGFVELAKPDSLSSAEEKNQVQRVMAAENEDRKALYNEIARLNKDQNLTVGAIERVYAQKRLERGETGELFQLPPEGADLDAFKASAKGRALGAACEPNAWVELP